MIENEDEGLLHDDYERRQGLYWWIEWQRIRRHPEYIKFCNDNSHLFSKTQSKFEGNLELSQKIRYFFKIDTIYHYSKNLTPTLCFENCNRFKKADYVIQFFPERDDGQPVCQDYEVVGAEKETSAYLIRNLPDDKNYIYLAVDVSENNKWEVIVSQIKRYIKFARAVRKIKPKDKRRHLEKEIQYFKVWDLRVKMIPFKQIADELKIKTVDLAIKEFQQAYYLIQGKEYDREFWKNLKDALLTNQALRPAIENGDATEIERILKKQEVKQQHLVDSEIISSIADHDGVNSGEARDTLISIKQLCNSCSDNDCRDKAVQCLETGEKGSWEPCPQVLELRF